MAPESVMDGIFTIKTDVWSFGILIYEVITLGNQPYIGLDNQEVVNFIKNGIYLDIPNECHSEL